MIEPIERVLSCRSLAWLCVVAVLAAYAFGFFLHYPRTVTLTDESLYLTQAKLIAESPLMHPWGRTATGRTDCGEGALSYAVHHAFAGWAQKHARAQELIYSYTTDEDVIVTDLKGTEKYINPLYGQRTVMKHDDLDPEELKGMLAVGQSIWVSILERRDSAYWIDRTTRAMQFVRSLSPLPG